MEKQSTKPLVLVTGANGFVASHVIHELLLNDYRVRGTVRSLKNTKKNEHIFNILPSKNQNLQLVEAELTSNKGWDQVMQDVEYVFHLASPFPPKLPKHESEVLLPAIEGTRNVFNAAIKNKVKKITFTSSIASIYPGRKENYFNESDYSNLSGANPYDKSKRLAEKEAWDFYQNNKDKIQLTIICPGIVFGPPMHKHHFTSGDLLLRGLKGDFFAIPKLGLPLVDVRDLARAFRLTIEKLEVSNGQRYIICEGSYWLMDLFNIMRETINNSQYKIAKFEFTNSCIFNLAKRLDQQLPLVQDYFCRKIDMNNSKSKQDLGLQYTYYRETIRDTANAFIKLGLAPQTPRL